MFYVKFLFNTFTANNELSCSPGFLYFCQLRDNLYFRDPLFLPTTSYLVVTKFIIFANYKITHTTLFLILHLLKNEWILLFCWKTKNTKNPYSGFSNIFKETFSVLPCYEISRSTEYGLIEISMINS